MSMNVRVGGVWKAATPSVKVAGVWKPVASGWVRVAGVWRKFYPDAAVQFVGAAVKTTTATGNHNFLFTSLLNESGVAPTLQVDDLIIVSPSISTGGPNIAAAGLLANSRDGNVPYTAATADLYSLDTNSSNQMVQYIWHNGTETGVSFTGTGNASYSFGANILVLRGVHKTTPLDVTPTTATGINTGLATCPAITPVTPGALIAIFGCGAISPSGLYTMPAGSGLSTTTNHFISGTADSSTDTVVGAALKFGHPAGTPATFAAFGGAMTQVANSWCGTTLALRPA